MLECGHSTEKWLQHRNRAKVITRRSGQEPGIESKGQSKSRVNNGQDSGSGVVLLIPGVVPLGQGRSVVRKSQESGSGVVLHAPRFVPEGQRKSIIRNSQESGSGVVLQTPGKECI